jgi:hypothetical protein
MADDEMKAIVETARSFGRKVAAHAHGVDGINAALRPAWTRSSMAPSPTTRPSGSTSRRAPITCRPCSLPPPPIATGSAARFAGAVRKGRALPAGNAEKSFARAVREGVKIAFGTDSAVSPHGKNAEEFALMVKNGMSPATRSRRRR